MNVIRELIDLQENGTDEKIARELESTVCNIKAVAGAIAQLRKELLPLSQMHENLQDQLHQMENRARDLSYTLVERAKKSGTEAGREEM